MGVDLMRNLYDFEVNQHRDKSAAIIAHYRNTGDDTCGVFNVPSPIDGSLLRVVASAGEGWDHVSVSRLNRCPNWVEMSAIHRLFFNDDEPAMQLHVPKGDHINHHPYCLHLWRPQWEQIPRPPGWMVGPETKKAG